MWCDNALYRFGGASVNQGRAKAVALLALCVFLVPLLGWLTGLYVESDYEGQFRDLVITQERVMTATEYAEQNMSYLSFCSNASQGGDNGDLADFCSFADEVNYVKIASWGSAAVGALLMALIVGGRLVAGTDRARMSRVFEPLVQAVMLLLAASVLAQAALFVYSIYTLEVAAIQRVHGGLLLAVALGAVGACWVLLKSSLQLMRAPPMVVRGEAVQADDGSRLVSLVNEVATALNAERPQNIVLGLEPNFYVTATDVRLLGEDKPLSGRTLFLSLALMRLFSIDELKAVIGHELGHFRGEDVAYSMRFAPTYARLQQALAGLGESTGGAGDLARLPALIALSMCLNEFASAERTVGRDRELQADRAGAEAAGERALARALVKVSLFVPQWNALARANIDELAEGRMFTNLGTAYAASCSDLAHGRDWQAIRDELGAHTQPHPIDTHPPLSQRLQNLGIPLKDVSAEECSVPERSAIDLVENVEALEQRLSVLEARWLVAIGAVVVPEMESKA